MGSVGSGAGGDQRHEDDTPQLWLSGVETSPFHIGQLVGEAIDLDDPEGDLDDALNLLMRQERSAVVSALMEGFGGVDGLFIALCRSNKEPQDDTLVDDDGESPTSETDADILNAVTGEKMAGYEWIDQGCESYGPLRFMAD